MCSSILSTSTTLVICLHPPALFGKNLAKGISSDSKSEEQDDSPSTATTLPVQLLSNQGMDTRDPPLSFPSNCRDVEDVHYVLGFIIVLQSQDVLPCINTDLYK